jgi:hypothetical protein
MISTAYAHFPSSIFQASTPSSNRISQNLHCVQQSHPSRSTLTLPVLPVYFSFYKRFLIPFSLAISRPGIVVTVVSGLIALSSLIFLAISLLSRSLIANKIKGGILGFLGVWLLATQIAFTQIFATKAAKVTAFLGGSQLPQALVDARQKQLGVTGVFKEIGYREFDFAIDSSLSGYDGEKRGFSTPHCSLLGCCGGVGGRVEVSGEPRHELDQGPSLQDYGRLSSDFQDDRVAYLNDFIALMVLGVFHIFISRVFTFPRPWIFPVFLLTLYLISSHLELSLTQFFLHMYSPPPRRPSLDHHSLHLHRRRCLIRL